jgi:hypothetical protein
VTGPHHGFSQVNGFPAARARELGRSAKEAAAVGWDFVTCGDRHAHLHDLQLWSLRHFLADAAGALAAEEPLPALFAEARAFFAEWGWPGPGVVTGTALGEFVRGSPDRERALVGVCDRALARLREFGGVVPLAYLEAHVNADSPGGVYIGDQPSALFVEGVERIRGLLTAGSAEPRAGATRGR